MEEEEEEEEGKEEEEGEEEEKGVGRRRRRRRRKQWLLLIHKRLDRSDWQRRTLLVCRVHSTERKECSSWKSVPQRMISCTSTKSGLRHTARCVQLLIHETS